MEYEKIKFCAGVVTYNPDIKLLDRCIKSVYNQVQFIILIDNGSKNISDINSIKVMYPNVILVANNENRGISFALNQIANEAANKKIDWFLTLDQDSICPENMISIFSEYAKIENVAIICPTIQLRIHNDEPIELEDSFEYVETAITSGCLVSTSYWEKAKGFWNYLFIDKVDDDFCYTVRECGGKIIRTKAVKLEHEIGRPSIHSVFGMKFYTDSYPSFRYYYIARNTIIVYSCHNDTGHKPWKILLKRGIKIIIGEKGKIDKLKCFVLGIIEGCKWKARFGERGNPRV